MIAAPLSIISYVNMAEPNGILISEEDIQKLIENGQYVLLNETNHENNKEISEFLPSSDLTIHEYILQLYGNL